MVRSGSRLGMGVTFLLLLGVLVPAHLYLSEYAVDDAYIHFRIAHNFVETGSPYFNPGEAVLATSSFLWTLLLSALFLLTGSSIAVVPVLNSILLSLNAVLWPLVIPADRRNWKLHSAPIVAIVLATLFESSVGLMETPLALALVAGGFSLSRSKPFFGTVLLTLGVFARLEVAVFALAYLVLVCSKSHSRWIKHLLLAAAVALPMIALELYYFGTLVPHTVRAKSIVYQISASDFVHFVFTGIFGAELMGYHKNLIAALIGSGMIILLVIIFTEKKFSAYVSVMKRDKEVFALALCGAVVLSAYFVKKVHLASWYMPIYELPILVLLLLICARRHRPLLTVLGGICISPFVFQLLLFFISLSGQPEYFPGFPEGARVRQYLSVSQELYQKHPESSVLTSEIGGIGFGFRGKVIDGAGLITPAALKFHPMSVPAQRPSGVIGAIPLAFIQEQKPDLILSLDIFITEFLSSEAVNQYSIRKLPVFRSDDEGRWAESGIWGANYLIVATRRE